MKCYIDNVLTDREVVSDVKNLIPDAAMRRRMSRVLKMGVSTAVECLGGVEGIDSLDAIITATGLGCLADSEKFLRNVISDNEEFLNPTPFIQSTFNTLGGQIALLRHRKCYNMTYVNGNTSFEDALLDALMLIADSQAETVLVGAFDEKTDSQQKIMARMGAYRHAECGEGCVFARVTGTRTGSSVATVEAMEFVPREMDDAECLKHFGLEAGVPVIRVDAGKYGVYHTASALAFADAVAYVRRGGGKAVVCNAAAENRTVLILIQGCGGSGQ